MKLIIASICFIGGLFYLAQLVQIWEEKYQKKKDKFKKE
tara:strand:- start:1205 stop:1321 length:117 start_codon:yes stop_codon:yes gene_type:complete